jgi:hypothetical protein
MGRATLTRGASFDVARLWRELASSPYRAMFCRELFGERQSGDFEGFTFVKHGKTAVFCRWTAVTRTLKRRERGIPYVICGRTAASSLALRVGKEC